MTLNNQSINSQVKAVDIVNQALNELGLPGASLINGDTQFATDFNTKQIIALLNAAGQELAQKYEWQILRRSLYFETESLVNIQGNYAYDSNLGIYVFTCTNPTAELFNIYQTGNLVNYNAVSSPIVDPTDPSDITYQAYPYTRVQYVSNPFTDSSIKMQFLPAIELTNGQTTYPTSINLCKVRFPLPQDYVCLVDGTGWDYTRHFPLIGPTTEQEWAWLVNGFVATAPRIRWAIFNNSLNVYPAYNSVERLTFIYKSNGWCGTLFGATPNIPNSYNLPTYQNKVVFPDDVVFFNDRLIISFIKYKLYAIKGLENETLYRDYLQLLDVAIAQDSALRNLSMAPDIANPFISWNNLPDSGYSTFSNVISYVWLAAPLLYRRLIGGLIMLTLSRKWTRPFA